MQIAARDDISPPRPGRRFPPRFRPAFPALFVLLLSISLAPIFTTQTLPLVDYYNHLARIHILLNLDGSPTLQQFYEHRWHILPNLGFEILAIPLAQLLPIEAVGKVVLALALASMAAGVAFLQHALHGKATTFCLFAFIFLYNSILIYGFMSYLIGLGGFLFALAAWTRWREHLTAPRLLALCLLSALLFLVHLYGFALYVLSAGAHEMSHALAARKEGRRRLDARWTALFLQFPLPLALLFLGPTGDAASTGSSFSDLLNKWHYWSKVEDLPELLAGLRQGFGTGVSNAVFFGLAALYAVGLASGKLRLARHTALPALAMLLAYALMPQILFSSWNADGRFPIAICLFLLAATAWDARSPRLAAVTSLLLVCATLVMTLVISRTWKAYDDDYQQYIAAIDRIPPGSRLTAAVALQGSWETVTQPPLSHVGTLAVLRRDGFFPTIFAHPNQQPISLTRPYREIHRQYHDVLFRNEHTGRAYLEKHRNPFSDKLLQSYDYILVVREHWFDVELPAAWEKTFEGREFRLYKISAPAFPPQQGAGPSLGKPGRDGPDGSPAPQ